MIADPVLHSFQKFVRTNEGQKTAYAYFSPLKEPFTFLFNFQLFLGCKTCATAVHLMRDSCHPGIHRSTVVHHRVHAYEDAITHREIEDPRYCRRICSLTFLASSQALCLCCLMTPE